MSNVTNDMWYLSGTWQSLESEHQHAFEAFLRNCPLPAAYTSERGKLIEWQEEDTGDRCPGFAKCIANDQLVFRMLINPEFVELLQQDPENL